MIDIPDNLEKRIKDLEEKAEKEMPGDYTIEANFFTDGDVHLVAVHNFSEQHCLRLHEGSEKPRRTGAVYFGGVKVPATMAGVFYE